MIVHALVSVENPWLSGLWANPYIVELCMMNGVAFVLFCMSGHGVVVAKPTAVLHNSPTSHMLRVPSLVRTPRATLRGRVKFMGEDVF